MDQERNDSFHALIGKIYYAAAKADKVMEIWDESKAKKAESIIGNRFILAGFWQRRKEFNELKVGDKIEVGLDHISVRSDHLSVSKFVRKVSE